MNLVGRLIGGRYEIIEKIGNGGMATVYKAKCHVLNRYVAVKVLRDEFTTDDEFIKRFNTEAQSAASLTHPNIVSIYDVGNEGDLYYIVMELIQGKTLKEIIIEDGALPWKWSVNIAIQIASALETAHKNNIVHRDIKPHNIIITEDGIAKVTDFGIAKAVSNSTITAFGTTIGSVHYFSPEHARGGFTDAKSDLYSLGVVMYEMLTGKVPFDADTPVSIALKHMQEKATEPIKLNPTIPFAVNKIIIKAMQKDINSRYTSATEMLRDLSMAIKNPDGNFVVVPNVENDYPTQKIPTMYDRSLETKIKQKDEENNTKNKKPKGKLGKFFEEHKGVKVLVMGGSIILLFVLALFATIFIMNATSPKQVQIPNFVGASEEEAKRLAEDNKIQIEIVSEEFNKEVPLGYIISQDPKFKENYRVLENSKVKLVISKGEEIVTVPKVVGDKKEDAISEIQKAGLIEDVLEDISETVEEGYVIKQEPEADEQVGAGSTVKVFVSTGNGKEKVDVPPLIGLTEEQAKKDIETAKLKLKPVVYEEDSTKENGVVLKQSIESGETVEEGTEIIITVNKIIEIKTATVNIDIKSLTGGYKQETTTVENVAGNSITTTTDKVVKTVTVEVKYGDKVETRTEDKNNTSCKISISGKDGESKDVQVTIKEGAEVLYQSSKTIKFGTDTTLNFNKR